jgi:hypothetical protein
MPAPPIALRQLLQPCADAGEMADVLLRLEKAAARLSLPPPPESDTPPGERLQHLTQFVRSVLDEYIARQEEFVAQGYGLRIGPSWSDVLARGLPDWYAEAAWALEQTPPPWWQFWKR